MAKDLVNYKKIRDFLMENRRQRHKCFALIIHFSRLEKRFRESGYRRQAALAFQPLITSYGARTFPMENADMVVLTADATADYIQVCLENMFAVFEASEILSTVSSETLVDNLLVSWFPLGEKYTQFEVLMKAETTVTAVTSADESAFDTGDLIDYVEDDVEVDLGDQNKGEVSFDKVRRTGLLKPFDIERLSRLSSALVSVDVGSHIVRQSVMAVVTGLPAIPVMTHYHIPLNSMLQRVFSGAVEELDLSSRNYVKDILTDRMLSSELEFGSVNGMIASVGVTVRGVFSNHFERFDKGLRDLPRKHVVLEFNLRDAISNPSLFLDALSKVRSLGFKTQLAGLTYQSFMWFDDRRLTTNFYKINAEMDANQLSPNLALSLDDLTTGLKERVRAIGPERVILSGCDTAKQIKWGQKAGIHLFCGGAVS